MNNLYEALAVCLQDIELGADIESSLLRFPDIADELRPILETSAHAKSLAVSVPSEDLMRRNRAKLLQRAAEMRETQLKSSSAPDWFNSFRRAAIALAVLVIAFLSGTGLVRASSSTLPGDNLYPVKRTYEDLALLFTIDSLQRNSLEVEYENERLDELHELIALGRAAEVDFAGIITEQNGNRWVVAGVPVIVSSQTDMQDGAVSVGEAVRVFGITQIDNSVLAERIDQLPEGAILPEAGNSGEGSEDESNSESGSGNSGSSSVNDSSGPGNGNDNSNENNSGPGGGGDNGNNSGPGGGNDNSNDINSGPGGGGDTTNNNGSESGNENGSNSGSGSIQDQSNDNGSEDNSGSGGGGDNSNEDNSGSGGGGADD